MPPRCCYPLKIDIFLPQFIAFGYVAVFGMRSYFSCRRQGLRGVDPNCRGRQAAHPRMLPRAAARPGAR